jgi:hypothetical protein
VSYPAIESRKDRLLGVRDEGVSSWVSTFAVSSGQKERTHMLSSLSCWSLHFPKIVKIVRDERCPVGCPVALDSGRWTEEPTTVQAHSFGELGLVADLMVENRRAQENLIARYEPLIFVRQQMDIP